MLTAFFLPAESWLRCMRVILSNSGATNQFSKQNFLV